MDDERDATITCLTCGAELAADAKFCAQCGTPVPVDGAEDDTPTEVLEPVEDADSEELPVTEALVVDATTTGVAASPALQRVIDTPPREPKPKRAARERRRLEEHGTWEEFVGAVVPVLRAPRFAGNLLGALVAFTFALATATVGWLLLDRVFETTLGLLPLAQPDDDQLGAITLLGLTYHQVPWVNEDVVRSGAPLLLAAIPIVGCALGVTVARRYVPASGDVEGFLARTAPFVLSYGGLCLAWSLIGAEDWHAAHASSLFAGIVFALIGAWLAERAARDELALAPARTRTRPARAARTGVRVFALMVVIASLGWLVGTIVAQVKLVDDGRGDAIAESVLNVVEGGFEAVAFGVGAEGTPFGTVDEDHGLRVWQLGDVLPDSTTTIYVIVALATVLIGGLFSGFAMARAAEPRSRNDHALYGAGTGVVWAVVLLLAQQLVFIWELDGDDRHSAFDGTQTVLLGLVIGAVLGAVGGMLAAGPRGADPVADND